METSPSSTAHRYAKAEFENTYWLGYRDLEGILNKFTKGEQALDYGCGTGRSSRFLKKLGYSVQGVDISVEMLDRAKLHDPEGLYHLIESGILPFKDSSFDLVFSCFVFLTVSSFDELQKIFSEIYRVLKPGGIFNFVTGSKYLYIKKYISYDVRAKDVLSSGKQIDVTLKDLGVSFKNYYWSDEDYRHFLSRAGFDLIHFEMPLGIPSEPFEWLDELIYSPYSIYTAKKPDEMRLGKS